MLNISIRCIKRLKWINIRCLSTASQKQPFPVLPDTKNQLELGMTNAKAKSQELLEQLEKINQICLFGGGEKGREVHIKKNKKVLPRDRVALLFDDADFLEVSLQAGLGMEYGDIPGGSVICAAGKINDRYCMVTANDATLKGGTYFPISFTKAKRSQDIGSLCSLPHVYVVDSGGGFLPAQSEIFPDKNHGGRGFYSEAVLSANNMPQLAIVCGSSTAGGAYVPVMCEDAVIVDRVGTIFLGGPPLVKAATGEVVSSEDLGGAMLHCSVSGCTDYFAATEAEGFEVIRELFSMLNIEEETPYLEENNPPLYDGKVLDDMCGMDNLDRSHVMFILSRLVDGSRFREFKAKYGQNLVTGYAHIDGKRVGVLVNCGPLSAADSLKGAQFIMTCEMRRISLIFLQNSGPPEAHQEFISSLSDVDAGITLRNRASMMAALSCASVDRVALNIGGCHGDDLCNMCGPSFDPNFLFCWPGTEATHISMNYITNSAPLQAPQNALRARIGKPAFKFDNRSSMYWATRVLNDGMITPSDTRRVLVHCMRIFAQKKRLKNEHKHFPMLKF